MISLDIIGNIKVDASKAERVKYFYACLKSYNFLTGKSKIVLNIESTDNEISFQTAQILRKKGFQGGVTNFKGNFGSIYSGLIKRSDADYILNFEDDHFCLLDNFENLQRILSRAEHYGVEVIRATFNKVENKSADGVEPIYEDDICRIFEMNEKNFQLFQHAYPRFFLGTNCIFKHSFATRFWKREFEGSKPHPWEIGGYDKYFQHTVLIPKIEILASIDDPHDEPGSSLIEREEKKWEEVYGSVCASR